MFEEYITTLLKAQHKIVEINRKLRLKIVRLNKPIDRIKTELWKNQQNINRLNREINECTNQ